MQQLVPVLEKCKNLKSGDVVLLENLRFYEEETKGEEIFARDLSRLANIYINDAFGTAHRAHASTTTVAKYFSIKAPGYLLKKEILAIEKVLKNIDINPKTFVLRAQSQNIKDQLRSKTNDAYKKGIFGAPTFIVKDKIFWGQDRLQYAIAEAVK